MAFTRIQEYVDTPDGTPGTLLIPKLILPALVEEVKKALIPRELSKWVMGPSQLSGQGSSFSVDLETANTGKIRVIAEGAEVPMDARDFTSVTFTPIKYGVAIRITREMMEDSMFDLMMANIRMAGRRFAENETALILTALDGADNTISGGAAITVANITTGMQNVDDQDYTPTDLIIGTEVLNDLRNIDTFVEFQKVGNTEMLQRGFLGTIYGLNVIKFSPNAAPTTTYKKYAYIFDRSECYGIAIKRDLTVENFNLSTFDMSGAVITQRIDVRLLRSAAVCRITTT